MLISWRLAPYLLIPAAIVAAIAGVTQRQLVEPELLVFLALPTMILLGIAAGSMIRIGNDDKKAAAAVEGRKWLALADDAFATGKEHVYVRCQELAGDEFTAAGLVENAVHAYHESWETQAKSNGVHAAMRPLGDQLIAAMRSFGLHHHAGEIAKALDEAESQAEAIVAEEQGC